MPLCASERHAAALAVPRAPGDARYRSCFLVAPGATRSTRLYTQQAADFSERAAPGVGRSGPGVPPLPVAPECSVGPAEAIA
jgi:hypothetical protein